MQKYAKYFLVSDSLSVRERFFRENSEDENAVNPN
jgi:hypothetical protein